jgi:hypothetical protein
LVKGGVIFLPVSFITLIRPAFFQDDDPASTVVLAKQADPIWRFADVMGRTRGRVVSFAGAIGLTRILLLKPLARRGGAVP